MIRTLAALPWNVVAATRIAMYRSGLLRSRELPRPTLSVGALEMGGTGKTPATVAVASALQTAGFRPAILSRGYGRVGLSPLLVSDGAGDGPQRNASLAGDEPWLMAHLLRDVPVAVAGARELAAALVPLNRVDVFVLDDAFQHVRVRRDVDLLMIDAATPFWNQHPPPFGRLREGVEAAARADGFLVRGDTAIVGTRWPAKPRLAIVAQKSRLLPLRQWLREPDSAAIQAPPLACVAFAGIARPERFFEDLRARGTRLALAQQYRDHQPYTTTEIKGLAERARLRDCDTLVTTEKDAARLAHLDLDDTNILVATHRLALRDEAKLLELLEHATAGQGE